MSLSGTMRNQISADEKTQLLTVAHEMAAAAKEAILPYFRGSDLDLENKDAADFDPVLPPTRLLNRRCGMFLRSSALKMEFGEKSLAVRLECRA